MGSGRAGPQTMKSPFTYRFLLDAFTVIFRLLTRSERRGAQHIPPGGPFLVVTNHLSYADPPFIFVCLALPRMTALVADKYKSNPLFAWVVNAVGGVWINRGVGDRGALRAAVDALKGGSVLGIAPEGTRSKVTHALMPGKTGAAYIASKAGVPILPVGLTGTDRVFSDLLRLRRPKITFTAGPTFTLPPLAGEAKSKTLDDYTREIMCRIAALLPEEYQGVYKGDPRIVEIRRMSGE